MAPPPPEHDPEAVRDLADRILAAPRYDQPPDPLPERIQQWFADRIGDVLGAVVGSGAGAVVAWAVLLTAIGAIAYLVVRHGRTVRVDRPHRGGPAPAMVELARSPDEWRAEAALLEAEGRWREALRCRHRALVAALVRRSVIPDQAGRTAREHLGDAARALPAAAPAMAAATELFEASWYGAAPTGAAESQRFQDLELQVLEGGRRPLAGAGARDT